jgi:hypothetical protein
VKRQLRKHIAEYREVAKKLLGIVKDTFRFMKKTVAVLDNDRYKNCDTKNYFVGNANARKSRSHENAV